MQYITKMLHLALYKPLTKEVKDIGLKKQNAFLSNLVMHLSI